ncbi:MAG TPA: MmgE/PrpD family protein [Firmicutes bacterium]|nr:MmgE/PrpD family protein [Bacillota bacterium]
MEGCKSTGKSPDINSGQSISRAIAELIAELGEPDKIPESAYAMTRKMILDTLGNCLAGWNAPGVLPVVQQMCEWGGKEEAHALIYGMKLPAPNAAFINSTLVHALDYDDWLRSGQSHIMSSVFPVALAVGELSHASGKEVMAAIIMGVEVAGRLGRAYRSRMTSEHFLPSTIIGGFGATAAACRLYQLDIEETVHALGLYYTQTSGNRQALYDKTLAKRIQPAFAARSAIWSAALAKRGLTGPLFTFEGIGGFYRIYAGKGEPPLPAEICAPLDALEIESIIVKQYPFCGECHAPIEAALKLVAQYNLEPRSIERVQIYLGNRFRPTVGMPFHLGRHPQVCAQFSVEYAVALALTKRQISLADLTDESIRRNKETLELVARTQVVTQIPHDIPPGGKGNMVSVVTIDGNRYTAWCPIDEVLDTHVMPYERVAAKFYDSVQFSGLFTAEQAVELERQVAAFAAVEDVAEFVSRLCVKGVAIW